jgi:DNA-binding GntR family transcriptional regulator
MPLIDTQYNLSMRKQIFDYLSNQIEKGVLTPGSLINVRKLTEELNVSRTPLREALAQLETQGFVTILPQRGVLINVLTYEELLNIYEILGALESQVLQTVFQYIDAKKIDAMERYNHVMAQAITNEQNRKFHETNITLHRVFLDLSNNVELTNYVSNLKLKLFGFALKSYRKRFKESIVREHEEFIELLRAGEKNSTVDYLKNVHWKFNYPENFIRPDTLS